MAKTNDVIRGEPGRVTKIEIRSATKIPGPEGSIPADAFLVWLTVQIGEIENAIVGKTFEPWADGLVVISLPEEDEEDDEGRAAGAVVSCRRKLPDMRWAFRIGDQLLADVSAQCRLSPKINLLGDGRRYVSVSLAATFDVDSFVALARHYEADIKVTAGDLQLGMGFKPETKIRADA